MDTARAVAGEHEADRIHAQLAGQAPVTGAGHAAELDPGTEQGPHWLSPRLTVAGKPHPVGYSGPPNTTPSGGPVRPAPVRPPPPRTSPRPPSPARPPPPR